MRMILAIFAMLAAGNLMAAPPDGIPREIARQRATQISDLRYHLRFTLTPHSVRSIVCTFFPALPTKLNSGID